MLVIFIFFISCITVCYILSTVTCKRKLNMNEYLYSLKKQYLIKQIWLNFINKNTTFYLCYFNPSIELYTMLSYFDAAIP